MKTYDAIIIGFGKGGKTLAADFAKRGMKVAVIERSSKMYGGTCINIGCIPTKTLVHMAKLATHMPAEERADFFAKALEMKEKVTSALRDKNYHNLADNPNIDVFTGTGSFLSKNTVNVHFSSGTSDLVLKSDNIIIDTGAETVIPKIKGIDGPQGIASIPNVFTSTSIMEEMKQLPKSLAIVGGGYIGLEFASIFASFGTKVTVLEYFPELITREDRDIAAAVKSALEKKGIDFKMNVSVQELAKRGDKTVVRYMYNSQHDVIEIESDAVLLATGRKANTVGLNLAAAGIETDERGNIKVDSKLVTSNPNVRAVGDVKGGLQFTYISLDDYRIVRDNMFPERDIIQGDVSNERSTADRKDVSYSVFIDPPLSRIGLGEDDARKIGLDVIVKKLPVMSIPRAKTIGETEGMLKAVIEKNTGKILGCSLFCPESSEMINEIAIVMKAGLSYKFLRDFIFTHPSMSEALNDLFM
jgi:pyruvate/2-oxoglutarate dehydrogenase complex dihydrolipoamide dehydrogenase (E3) component